MEKKHLLDTSIQGRRKHTNKERTDDRRKGTNHDDVSTKGSSVEVAVSTALANGSISIDNQSLNTIPKKNDNNTPIGRASVDMTTTRCSRFVDEGKASPIH